VTLSSTTDRSPAVPTRTRPALVLAAVAFVQFLVSLDISIVNVGLPQIANGLGFSDVGVTWVMNAYALTFGGLLLLGGKAADRFGRRTAVLFGLAVFALASLVGGLAQTPAQLVAARACQGIGAATLAPAALALLTATFPTGRARVRAFGVWSAVNAAGGVFGVLAGGLLTDYGGWRWVLLVNVPMAAVGLVLACLGIPRDRVVRRRSAGPDVAGAFLVTAGTTLLVLGIVRTERFPWTSAVTVTTLAVAAGLLALFVQVERTTTREALVRPGLLANRSVAGTNAVNLLVGAALTASFYFISLYLQQVLGARPARTGIMFLPFGFGVIAGSALAVKLGYRMAARTLLIGGGVLTAAGFAWFGLVLSPGGTFLGSVLGPSIVAGLGFGLCLGPVVSAATAGVPPHEVGAASALLNSSRQIGGSLGLAVLGTVAHHTSGGATTAEALSHGYALGLFLAAGLLIAAVGIALTVLPRTSPNGASSTGPPGPDRPIELEPSEPSSLETNA
jgi:EmrB/QacA subfamily drug resistance transporter